MTRPSSKSTPSGRAGRVPTAITTWSAVTTMSGVVARRGGDGGPLAQLRVQRIRDVLAAVGDVLEDRLAQRLGRHGPGVDGDAADALAPLDDRDALAELRM